VIILYQKWGSYIFWNIIVNVSRRGAVAMRLNEGSGGKGYQYGGIFLGGFNYFIHRCNLKLKIRGLFKKKMIL
jgi:hypothetical protein